MSLFSKKKKIGRLRTQTQTNFGRQIFWGIVRLICTALVFVLIYYVTRLQMFTITDVTVTGGETISHTVIQDTVLQELQGNYFLIVPKKFTYLYPHDRIVSVLEKNPRMYGITVSRTSRSVVEVSFKEYLPHALWCAGEASGTPCYFIDTEGYAFAEAPNLGGGALVRHTVEGVSELSTGIVIPRDKLASIHQFIAAIEKELGFRITSLTHTAVGDITFNINGGGMIYAAGDKNFEVTLENVRSVLAAPEFSHIQPGNFRYIDARFDNKVFVNEELSTSTEPVLELSE